MTSVHVSSPELITGQRMTREEFLCRWEALPDLKHAELIEGIVYVGSPVSIDHGTPDTSAIAWLAHYAWHTPGCEAGNEVTWMMLESSPQPDAFLMISPEYGGQARRHGKFWGGAPDLAVEICVTSTEHDFGPKLALYQRAGVREYITFESFRERIIWRVLVNGSYVQIPPDADGNLRSRVFPGLWLNPTAFWANDGAALESLLEQGLASAEHAAFVEQLQRAPANRNRI
jgi:Uma2 family endonuclease